ncbi:MAG: hypothetical protein MUE52_09590 [Tabrizicola sp.]|jgi:hypothetical protein|nr:hypothetical protein [Tabrizicola sp.]
MKRWTLLLLTLSACGPISMETAERQCFDRARLAQQPRGEVILGMSSGGKTAAGIELDISSDYLLGRDPSEVFESCVMQKTGQMPSRSFMQMPGWKG